MMSTQRVFLTGVLLGCALGIILTSQLTWTTGLPTFRIRPLSVFHKDNANGSSPFSVKTRVEERPCPLFKKGNLIHHDIPATALVSFPGSGNTWTRHLLTTATGVETGAVYNENIGVYIHRANQGKAKKVIAVKTHKSPKETRQSFSFERCILLIRNPYEALLAEFNREGIGKGMGHHVIVPKAHFQKWPSFVSKRKGGWSGLYLGWLAECKPPSLHVLVYSRMVHDLPHELHALFGFFNTSFITPRVDCAVRHREGHWHREQHAWQKDVAVFREADKRFLNAAIDKVRAALEGATGQRFEDFQNWKR